MLRLTRKQIIFLAVYPLIHILISVPFFLMAICNGLGPPDVGDPPISAQQEIVSRIGHHVIDTLWAPTFFLMHSLSCQGPLLWNTFGFYSLVSYMDSFFLLNHCCPN